MEVVIRRVSLATVSVDCSTEREAIRLVSEAINKNAKIPFKPLSTEVAVVKDDMVYTPVIKDIKEDDGLTEDEGSDIHFGNIFK
jgi:hypothetical protein